MIKVLLIGPSLKSNGGVSSVLNKYLTLIQEEFYKDQNKINLQFQATQIDGSKKKKLIYAILSLAKFLKILLFNKPHIVHAQTGIGMGFWRKTIFLYIALVIGCKTILHLHTSSKEYYEKLSTFQKKQFRNVLNRVDKILTVTTENQQFISSLLHHQQRSKVSMIENPIQVKNNQANRLKNSLDSYPLIFHLGELCKEKGIYDFLDLAKKSQDLGFSYKFIAAGAGEILEVENYIKRKKILNFEYLGFIDDLQKEKVFQKTRYLVLLTKFDQKPMVIQEALSYGVPCITSNVGGIPDMIKNGENGFIFFESEYRDILKKLNSLSENDYFEMVMAAYKSAERYKPSNISRELEKIYIDILAGKDRKVKT